MNVKNKLVAGLVGALALGGMTTASFAGSEIQPGISTGIPLGAPLPQGVFIIDMPNYGFRDSTPGQTVGALVPAWTIWSTPWTILGGHVLFDVATPMADVNVHNVLHQGGLANPLIESQLKWDLGGGFFGGFHAGAYLPMKNDLTDLGISRNFASFQAVAALSYLADGWDLSATTLYGTGKPGSLSNPGSYGTDWINVDVTATKKFGKFEVGMVGFGSADLSAPYTGYAKQSQIALGGLIGYDFGFVTAQIKLTRDVVEANYGGYDTRVWANFILPLWVAPAPVVAAKY